MECGQASRDRGVEGVAVIGGELSPLGGEVDVDVWRVGFGVAGVGRGRVCVCLWHLDSPCRGASAVSFAHLMMDVGQVRGGR